ncbi:MAG: peptide deformylase [Ruminococcaceae bacterium]|nr:peptide deformylase [Oscillospiraceae bacterium]
MAIRNIRKLGDEVLTKKCRPVETIDERILTLLDDMTETMYDADGVGLAAPQVGILRRVVVIDVGDGVLELINPEIVNLSGEQRAVEGCLSVPGRYGEVIRPQTVVVRALDRNGDEYEVIGEGLLARALCHEIDHLDGTVFVDKVVKFVEVEQE